MTHAGSRWAFGLHFHMPRRKPALSFHGHPFKHLSFIIHNIFFPAPEQGDLLIYTPASNQYRVDAKKASAVENPNLMKDLDTSQGSALSMPDIKQTALNCHTHNCPPTGLQMLTGFIGHFKNKCFLLAHLAVATIVGAYRSNRRGTERIEICPN